MPTSADHSGSRPLMFRILTGLCLLMALFAVAAALPVQASNGSIGGRVTDHAGNPLQGVSVHALSAGGGGWGAQTNAAGNYSFGSLPVGSYRITFAGTTRLLPIQYYNNASTVGDATLVAVAAGQAVTGINAQYDMSASVRGMVTDRSSGTPLAGIRVRINYFSDEWYSSWLQATTDISGTYTFAALVPGDYRLYFYDPDDEYVPQYYDGAREMSAATAVSATSGVQLTANAILDRGGCISGRVADQENDAPIAGVSVSASAWMHRTTTSDAQGEYRICGLAEGNYSVSFSHQDYQDQSYPNSTQVALGQTAANINMALQRLNRISGVVRGAGQPLANAHVSLYQKDSSGSYIRWWAMSYTDQNGSYTTHGLPDGDYKVEVRNTSSASNWASRFYPTSSTLSGADELSLSGGITRTVDVDLVAGATLSGRVTAADTGAGMATNVTFYINDGDTWRSVGDAWGGNDGNYSLNRLASGEYRLCFSPNWEARAYLIRCYNNQADLALGTTVTVAAGATLTGIDTALPLGGSITGQIYVGDAPLNPWMHESYQELGYVVLYREVGGEWQFYQSQYLNAREEEGAGAYRFVGLPTGNYRVGLPDGSYEGNARPAYHPAAATLAEATTVAVTQGQALSGIDIVAQPGGAMSGVVRVDGVRQYGVHIVAYDAATRNWVASTYSNRDGSYRLPRLATGSYLVRFGASGGLYTPAYYNQVAEMDAATPVAVVEGVTTGGIDADLTGVAGGDAYFSGVHVAGPRQVEVFTPVRYEAALSGGRNVALSWHMGAEALTSGPTLDYTFNATGTYTLTLVASNSLHTMTNTLVVDVFRTAPELGTITGQARTSGGVKLPGVHVVANRIVAGVPPFVVGTTRTDAEGNYSLANLPVGQYQISFYDPTNQRRQFYNQAGSASSATLVAVQDRATTSSIDAVFADPLPPAAQINGNGSGVTSDPDTGLVTVSVANGRARDLVVVREVVCANGATPSAVTLHLGTAPFPMSEHPTGSGIFRVTIPASQVAAGELKLTFDCGAGAERVDLGRVVLFDPSGFVRDANTLAPIEGAVVQIFNVPSYAPKVDGNDTRPNTCETPATLNGRTWDNLPAANEALGIIAAADPNLIDPQVNPQVTGVDGYYGWDVARGCWYITVEAPGYERRVSTMVGVPPEVLDLHMHLTPLTPAQTPTLNFAEAQYQVNEGAQQVEIAVTLSIPLSNTVTVNYQSNGGTALAGGDYTALIGTLRFAPGETRKVVTLDLLDNARLSGERSVNLALNNAVGARLGEQAHTTLTIRDSQVQVFLPLVAR